MTKAARPPARIWRVSHWMGTGPTLLAGAGVCRDYAHLVIAVLRAVNVPARLVSVYAPGCQPMDFHAVAEAYVDGQWRVVDATRGSGDVPEEADWSVVIDLKDAA